jgi:hypothetical protein
MEHWNQGYTPDDPTGVPFTQMRDRLRGRGAERPGGIDWGNVRLGFSYNDEPAQEGNLEWLDDYRDAAIPWGWIYAGGLVGLLAVVWMVKR